MSNRNQLDALAEERILILDGAMGTMIQSLQLKEADYAGDFLLNHPVSLYGCNDLLCLTKPRAIAAIHEAYLEAGADIIETCSFNSTAISLADYRISGLAYELSAAAASIARAAADKFSREGKPRFVAGCIGPTAKSSSMSPDIGDPGRRGIRWDALLSAYSANIQGLLDGGVDILLIETIYDTLNAKAALMAIERLFAEYPRYAARFADIPIMISATISGASGRLLAGQTIEAFLASMEHGKPWSVGLNCSFGAASLKPWLTSLAVSAPCLVSAHPNAGLPNRFGEYEESPESMASQLEEYIQEGLVNILGGCCGSTPAHIAAIAELAQGRAPRPLAAAERSEASSHCTVFSGLDIVQLRSTSDPASQSKAIGPESLVIVGERTNVAGCQPFLDLIKEERYEEALRIPREMIHQGAQLINIGMDDPFLDSKTAMIRFLTLALADPEIAQVPFMIDSSNWEVIEAALKYIQGKALVNSISLKEGSEEFLRKAELARRYGAGIVVMLFDEAGQAATYKRKIAIAERSYNLLVADGFPPEDIVFDPNILTIATGIPEHDSYALDFIHACLWIREHCPAVQISGGLTNLSFSFRGNPLVREALHSTFLRFAIPAGLTMAIMNPAAFSRWGEIPAELAEAAADLVLHRSPTALDRMVSMAVAIAAQGETPEQASRSRTRDAQWRSLPLEERISHAVVTGTEDYIETDVLNLQAQKNDSIAIVEGPLMAGIVEAGNRYEAGAMYLPQIIQSARVMKRGVAVLEPFIKAAGNSIGLGEQPGKIVLATVKGDVHDIGKNIVSLVLGCSGYTIIDLGVMVSPERIIEAALQEKPVLIGLSGLISPSLQEMVNTARMLAEQGISIPLLIGGATTSLAHTALRIAPEYPGPVVYLRDASRATETVRALLSPRDRPGFLEALETRYQEAVAHHGAIAATRVIIPLEEARQNRYPAQGGTASPEGDASANPYKAPKPLTEELVLSDYPLEQVIPHLDWNAFYRAWGLNARDLPDQEIQKTETQRKEAEEQLYKDATALLAALEKNGGLHLRGVIRFFPALSENEDIILYDRETYQEKSRLQMLRNQEKKYAGRLNSCLADFVYPLSEQRTSPGDNSPATDWIGLFALSAGFGVDELEKQFRSQGDEYRALLVASLANSLAEAFSMEMHRKVQQEFWGYAPKPPGWGIAPAFGYPVCPDHRDKEIAFDLLRAQEQCGLALTESGMMLPAASVCGLYLANPASHYFGIGFIGEDQLALWAERKQISLEEARIRINQFAAS